MKIQERIRFLQISLSMRFFSFVRQFFPILRCRLMISRRNQTEEISPVAVAIVKKKNCLKKNNNNNKNPAIALIKIAADAHVW